MRKHGKCLIIIILFFEARFTYSGIGPDSRDFPAPLSFAKFGRSYIFPTAAVTPPFTSHIVPRHSLDHCSVVGSHHFSSIYGDRDEFGETLCCCTYCCLASRNRQTWLQRDQKLLLVNAGMNSEIHIFKNRFRFFWLFGCSSLANLSWLTGFWAVCWVTRCAKASIIAHLWYHPPSNMKSSCFKTNRKPVGGITIDSAHLDVQSMALCALLKMTGKLQISPPWAKTDH